MKNMVFIFDFFYLTQADEASQVDLLTGMLALSCASNVVIVGDTMQLPNVVSNNDRKRAIEVGLQFNIEEPCRYEEHSLTENYLYKLENRVNSKY